MLRGPKTSVVSSNQLLMVFCGPSIQSRANRNYRMVKICDFHLLHCVIRSNIKKSKKISFLNFSIRDVRVICGSALKSESRECCPLPSFLRPDSCTSCRSRWAPTHVMLKIEILIFFFVFLPPGPCCGPHIRVIRIHKSGHGRPHHVLHCHGERLPPVQDAAKYVGPHWSGRQGFAVVPLPIVSLAVEDARSKSLHCWRWQSVSQFAAGGGQWGRH